MISKRFKERDAEFDLSFAELNKVRTQAMKIDELTSDSISQAETIEEQETLIGKLGSRDSQLEEEVTI